MALPNDTTDHIRAIKAVIGVAQSNYPRDSSLTIAAKGENNATITVPSWALSQIVAEAEKSE